MTKVIAHRGASMAEKENTVEAFRAAVAQGADAVELDVRRTADGATVVHHDAHLADGRLIVEHSGAEMPSHVPTLRQALAACQPLVVNIEIKNFPTDPDFDDERSLVPLVLNEVTEAGLTERVIVSSFDMGSIDAVRELAPQVATAWLVGPGDPHRLIERTARHGHRGIHPLVSLVDAEFVATAHEAGLFVNVWTVDDPNEIARLAALGVDGIVTNVPDRTRAVLGDA